MLKKSEGQKPLKAIINQRKTKWVQKKDIIRERDRQTETRNSLYLNTYKILTVSFLFSYGPHLLTLLFCCCFCLQFL